MKTELKVIEKEGSRKKSLGTLTGGQKAPTSAPPQGLQGLLEEEEGERGRMGDPLISGERGSVEEHRGRARGGEEEVEATAKPRCHIATGLWEAPLASAGGESAFSPYGGRTAAAQWERGGCWRTGGR